MNQEKSRSNSSAGTANRVYTSSRPPDRPKQVAFSKKLYLEEDPCHSHGELFSRAMQRLLLKNRSNSTCERASERMGTRRAPYVPPSVTCACNQCALHIIWAGAQVAALCPTTARQSNIGRSGRYCLSARARKRSPGHRGTRRDETWRARGGNGENHAMCAIMT